MTLLMKIRNGLGCAGSSHADCGTCSPWRRTEIHALTVCGPWAAVLDCGALKRMAEPIVVEIVGQPTLWYIRLRLERERYLEVESMSRYYIVIAHVQRTLQIVQTLYLEC